MDAHKHIYTQIFSNFKTKNGSNSCYRSKSESGNYSCCESPDIFKRTSIGTDMDACYYKYPSKASTIKLRFMLHDQVSILKLSSISSYYFLYLLHKFV